IPLLVKGLVDLDGANKYYVTSDVTQTLLGLADAVSVLEPNASVKAKVDAAGQVLGEEMLGPTVKTWSLPPEKLEKEIPISIANTGAGPVYFGAFLQYAYPATARLPSANHGFSITREYR